MSTVTKRICDKCGEEIAARIGALEIVIIEDPNDIGRIIGGGTGQRTETFDLHPSCAHDEMVHRWRTRMREVSRRVKT